MQDFTKLLAQYVAFRSISTDASFLPEIQKTVDWLTSLFEQNGFAVKTFKGVTCNPIVFASYIHNEDAKTVLIYGHYDVQPAAKEDGWFEDPFKLFVDSERLYARGVVDNKGQTLVNIYTVLELIKSKELKYNVKFLIEGNEETSNSDITEIIKREKELLHADYALISDGEIIAENPVVEYSLRGGFNLTLRIKTLANNLHSGSYGGTVPNALTEASKLIAKFFDTKNKVAIDGFYDDVAEITPRQIEVNKKLSENVDVLALTGAAETIMEEGLDYFTQTGLRPTISVTSILGGYQGAGYANIVPAQADIKINFRTVPNQQNEKVIDAFRDFLEKTLPGYVDWEITHIQHPYSWVRLNTESDFVQEVAGLLHDAYGTKALFKPVGGGIPVVANFKEVLGLETLLVPYGNEDCNMHGVNENFQVDLLEKALLFARRFFSL